MTIRDRLHLIWFALTATRADVVDADPPLQEAFEMARGRRETRALAEWVPERYRV